MAAIGGILTIVGTIMMLVGWIMVLIPAFKESVGWGIAGLLIGLVALIYGFMHWDTCKKGMKIWLIGIGVLIVGTILAVTGAVRSMPTPVPPPPPGMFLLF